MPLPFEKKKKKQIMSVMILHQFILNENSQLLWDYRN